MTRQTDTAAETAANHARPQRRRTLPALSLMMTLLLGGCAVGSPPQTVAITAPPQWYAPLPAGNQKLPHEGKLAGLSQWWQQQGDTLLVELIEAAQAASPSVVSARANIEQAQAALATSSAALLPKAEATADVSRSLSAPVSRTAAAPVNLRQLGLQASWEIDVFGENSASRNASGQRLQGAEALWHDARVSVAAELARQYYALRSCEKLLEVAQADAASRAETARLTAMVTKAGFEAPANSALAQASAAESRARTRQQRAQCELDVKALVALTALPEPLLRQKLADKKPASVPEHGFVGISAIPAEVLAQRPDVFNAARELNAASFEVGSARAQKYPQLSLTGSIANSRSRSRGVSQSFDTWSIGPLALSVPLFDGGASDANIAAAKARYDEAAGKYRAISRQAVREVEEALVNLQGSADRTDDAAQAAKGYSASFAGTQARYQAGLASLVELEDARRTLLSAQSAVVSLELERRTAWVALYRALGGGWSNPAPDNTSMVFEAAGETSPAQPARTNPN